MEQCKITILTISLRSINVGLLRKIRGSRFEESIPGMSRHLFPPTLVLFYTMAPLGVAPADERFILSLRNTCVVYVLIWQNYN